MKFYTYVYRDPSRKNEPIYVGKGQDDRAYVHLKNAQNNYLRNRLAKMKRNGIEPIINVVDMTSEALAIQCEIDTIARFGRKDLKLGPLLNQTDGGEGTSGCIPSPETCQKQSDAKKGENNPMYGKSHSPEHRKKMSDAKKGKPKPRITCPHCGKDGDAGSMSRWHFDNCKYKKQLEK